MTGSWRARSPPTPRSGYGWTRSATTPRSPASSASSRRRRRPAAGRRCSPTGSRSGCSTSPPPPPRSRSSPGRWWATLDDAVVRTVTVLVIACPHALGLAIPLVIALSTAVSARAGILVKDRLALERMRTVDTVLFDKTGTLTKGAHKVTGVTASRCCRWPRRSRPTANTRWPRRSWRRAGVVPAATDFWSLTGRGVQATVDGSGTPSAVLPCCASWVSRRRCRPVGRSAGRRCSMCCGCGTLRSLGALALEDEVRPEAREAIAELRGRAYARSR